MLALLRERTHEVHERLENALPLLQAEFSRADYRDFLARFHALYAAIQPKLDARHDWGHIGLDWKARRALFDPLRALENDMTFLEVLPCDAPHSRTPVLDSLERALGAAYVVEGSTLGGQIIGRHLRERWNLDARRGAAFFNGYAAQTGAMWTDFRAALHRAEMLGLDAETVAHAARDTFEAFEAVLCSDIRANSSVKAA